MSKKEENVNVQEETVKAQELMRKEQALKEKECIGRPSMQESALEACLPCLHGAKAAAWNCLWKELRSSVFWAKGLKKCFSSFPVYSSE